VDEQGECFKYRQKGDMFDDAKMCCLKKQTTIALLPQSVLSIRCSSPLILHREPLAAIFILNAALVASPLTPA